MVITKPLKVLVCLAFSLLTVSTACLGYTVPDTTGIQGDALSAEPRLQSGQQLRTRPAATQPKTYTGGSVTSSKTLSYPTTTGRSLRYSSVPMDGPVAVQASAPAACSPMPLPADWCVPYLPRQGCKQFSINAKLWYAELHNSLEIWGTNLAGAPGTELDLHRDLGLTKRRYIPEYEAKCQLRPRWGVRYSFMPIQYSDNFTPTNFFYFGNAVYSAGLSTLTKWDRYIQRAELVYDWYSGKHAVSAITAGYSYYDDKLRVSNVSQSRSRSQNFGLATAGMTFERAIRTLGRSTISTNCKWSVQFLEGYLGWDGYAAGRVAVPMENGRFGYIEAGWRWIVLERKYPTNADQTNLDGVTAAAGMVF